MDGYSRSYHVSTVYFERSSSQGKGDEKTPLLIADPLIISKTLHPLACKKLAPKSLRVPRGAGTISKPLVICEGVFSASKDWGRRTGPIPPRQQVDQSRPPTQATTQATAEHFNRPRRREACRVLTEIRKSRTTTQHGLVRTGTPVSHTRTGWSPTPRTEHTQGPDRAT